MNELDEITYICHELKQIETIQNMCADRIQDLKRKIDDITNHRYVCFEHKCMIRKRFNNN